MAKTNKAAEIVKFDKSLIDRVWEGITVENWLNLQNSGSLGLRKNREDDIVSLCPHPDHADTSPSFHIYPKKKHGHCFGCGYHPIDPIELISNICKTTYTETLIYISSSYPGVQFLKNSTYITQSEQQLLTQESKELFYEVCHQQLILAAQAYAKGLAIAANPRNKIEEDLYSDDGAEGDVSKLKDDPDYPGDTTTDSVPPPPFPSNVIPITAGKDGIGLLDFDYATQTIHWLVSVRKLPLNILPDLPIGIVPPISAIPNLAKQLLESPNRKTKHDNALALIQTISEFLNKDVNKGVSNSATGGVVFPLCTAEEHIAAFRIRLPNAVGANKRITLLQDNFEPGMGFFGLNFGPYREFLRNNSTQKIKSYVVVEGEFDALQPMVQCLQTGVVECAVVSAGGTSSLAAFDSVIQLNDVKYLYLIGDAPSKGNSNSSANVLAQWINTITAPECGVVIFTDAAWEKLAPAEDLDNAYVLPALSPQFISSTILDKDSYKPAWSWLVDAAILQLQEYTADDVTTMTSTAISVGRTLHRKEDIEAYVQALCNLYPILRPNPIKNGIISNDSNIKTYIDRVAEVLRSLFTVIGVDRSSSEGATLVLYNKRQKQFARVKLDSERSIIQEIASITGTIITFLEKEVGLPSCIVIPDNSLSRIDKELRYILREAVLQLVPDAPSMSNLKNIRNGYHHLDSKEILVHGTDAYDIIRTDNDISYNLLPSPRIGNILVDTYKDDAVINRKWFNRLEPLTPDVLRKAQQYDMKKVYHDLCRYFDTGFIFAQQDLNCQLLAALILTFPIMSCFDRQVVVHFTGETGSGKTTLQSVFSEVEKDSSNLSIQLLYASRYVQHITVPALAFDAEDCAILYCVDELESDTVKNKQATDQFLEMLRGATSGNSSRTTMNRNGEGTITRCINVPVIFGSITGTDKPQDLNRIISINMVKRIGYSDPNSSIHRVFSPQELYDLRLAVNFGMYSHIPKVREHYTAFRSSYDKIKDQLESSVEFRFMSAFFPVFAVLETIGIDYMSFFKEYVKNNESLIRRTTQSSDADTYLTKILHHSVIRLSDFKETAQCQSLARIIANRSWRQELNDTGVGVFYDELKQLMLFNIEQVITHLLPSHERNTNATSALNLRNTLGRHPAALTDEAIKESGILSRASMSMGIGVSIDNVMVFNGRYWLDAHDANIKSASLADKGKEKKKEEAEEMQEDEVTEDTIDADF